MRRVRGCAVWVLVLALFFATPRAHADVARALSAARRELPRETGILVGLDVSALQKTSLDLPLVGLAFTELEPVLDKMGERCGVSLMSAVQGVVIGADKMGQQGAVFVSLQGIDRARIESSLVKPGPAVGLSAKKDGSVWQLSVAGKAPIFAAWVDSDVLAFALDPDDKRQLLKWTGWKGALAESVELSAALGKALTDAPVWAVSARPEALGTGMEVRSTTLALDLAKGTAAIDIRMRMADDKGAALAGDALNTRIALIGNRLAPGDVEKLLQGLKISVAGDELSLQLSMPEPDLLAMVRILTGLKGMPTRWWWMLTMRMPPG